VNKIIDQCSLFSVYLEATFNNHCTGADEVLCNATGSVYEHKGQPYLVTNWHVLSGRDTVTGKPLDDCKSTLPEKISVFIPQDGALAKTIKIEYSLKDEHGKYTWLQHDLGREVDIGLLPIDLPEGISNFPINSINEARGIKDFPENIHVGQEVFVLGFPLGMRNAGGLPIWKKASIASEPTIPVGGNDYKILIDTATRKGMSGSPVIIAGSPDAQVQPDHRLQTISLRPYKIFIGIYSGRICGKDEFAAQLGIVWKENAIREIINSKVFYADDF
jgi:hypothetical protein